MYYVILYESQVSIVDLDTKSKMAARRHLGFADRDCVFGQFFLFGPEEQLCQRRTLYYKVKFQNAYYLYYNARIQR